LHSFKNAQQLRVGVRDILGKEMIEATTGALSDIAETCLAIIAKLEREKLIAKFGEPLTESPAPPDDAPPSSMLWPPRWSLPAERVGQPCQFAILALGKFGGRELNYYSDLDVMFVYEAEGNTRHDRRGQRAASTTTNQHFFSELGQRIIKRATQLGPFGRLYQIDPRLRPTGRSGSLAISLSELERYFARGEGQLWERQALCKTRVVFGGDEFSGQVMSVVHRCAFEPKLTGDDLATVRDMRTKLEETAEPGNLKRGPGGLVDIEFLVQSLQLQHGEIDPTVRVPGTLAALAALCQSGILSPEDFEYLSESFRFLRTIEARLRLMSTTARDDLPQQWSELAKLASLLGYASPDNLLFDCRHYTSENRKRFERLLKMNASS
jgi:glutamate-ammonia-ligase adenylyltransferase